MADKQIRVSNLHPTEEGSYLLVIEDIASHKKFGILTLKNEAMYILTYIFNRKTPRPSLYEVFSNHLKSHGSVFLSIRISQYKQNIYYAELHLKNLLSGDIEYIDIKATDAIALAYLNKVPLFADDSVIDECSEKYKGILSKFEKKENIDNFPPASNENCETLFNHTLYQQKLKQAIDMENYELAAELKRNWEQSQSNKKNE